MIPFDFNFCLISVPDCSCARKLPTGLQTDAENVTEPFNPIATNGEPFPWLNLTLPTYARPMRYMVTIHPNLTTLDVKGMYICVFCVRYFINILGWNVDTRLIIMQLYP